MAVTTSDITIRSDTPVRELDRRINDGIEVSLLWNSHTGRVSVAVEDARRDESFEFEVDPSQALSAFFHPYVYAPARTTISPANQSTFPFGHGYRDLAS